MSIYPSFYPASHVDDVILAFILQVVGRKHKITSRDMFYLLYFATRPEQARVWFSPDIFDWELRDIKACTPPDIFLEGDRPLYWQEAREYLTAANAITIGDAEDFILSPGPKYDYYRTIYSGSFASLIAFAETAWIAADNFISQILSETPGVPT